MAENRDPIEDRLASAMRDLASTYPVPTVPQVASAYKSANRRRNLRFVVAISAVCLLLVFSLILICNNRTSSEVDTPIANQTYLPAAGHPAASSSPS
jgi:uncharacterized membrane protein YesL